MLKIDILHKIIPFLKRHKMFVVELYVVIFILDALLTNTEILSLPIFLFLILVVKSLNLDIKKTAEYGLYALLASLILNILTVNYISEKVAILGISLLTIAGLRITYNYFRER